jgi:hypothetical protein
MFIVAAESACAAPAPYGGSIPIDHAGFLGRWRRACALGKVSSPGGSCPKDDAAPPETDESDEPDSSDEPDDADAPDGSNTFDGSGASADSGEASFGPGGGRPR